MSLLQEYQEQFVLMKETDTDDGYGGFIRQLTEGEKFKAALRFDDSLEARRASAQGVVDRYTVLTDRRTVLNYHAIIKRIRDGKMFRVTADGEDNVTPRSAGIDIRAVSAEEWKE